MLVIACLYCRLNKMEQKLLLIAVLFSFVYECEYTFTSGVNQYLYI